MVNSVMLVGRLAQDIEVKKLESGKEVTKVGLAVPRSFKNPDGIYETDFFDCIYPRRYSFDTLSISIIGKLIRFLLASIKLYP